MSFLVGIGVDCSSAQMGVKRGMGEYTALGAKNGTWTDARVKLGFRSARMTRRRAEV